MEVQWIKKWMQENGEKFTAAGQQLWEYAETGLEERRSADLLCGILEQQGFQVEHGLAGIPTAFVGRFGSGRPSIAILGEFDALEGLSQKAGSLLPKKREGSENGHGCGHNLLGSGSLAAAAAVKEYMEANGLSGTVSYYGCPGEEFGCGKTYMAREGCFDQIDAALVWHPMDENLVEGKSSLADLCTVYRFAGKAAHASVCPHQGRSALDAAELLNIACNFLREHMIPEARIHYAFLDAGGTAPNVVPASASLLYEVRAPKLSQALELRERVIKAARGAALMTETELIIEHGDGYSDYIPNDALNRILDEKLMAAGGPDFTAADLEFAGEIRKTYTQTEEEQPEQSPLHTEIQPYRGIGGCIAASTDVGDVSYIVPTAQLYTACCAAGTPSHSWQMVSQTGNSIGMAGMIAAARVLALTAAELLENPEKLEAVRQEHKRNVRGGYHCPIAPERKPAVPEWMTDKSGSGLQPVKEAGK